MPGQTRSNQSPYARFYPYLPFIRMFAGCVVLVLLSSAAIRLTPLFLAYLEQEPQVARSYAAIIQDSTHLSLAKIPGEQTVGQISALVRKLRPHRAVSLAATGSAKSAVSPAPSPGESENTIAAEHRPAREWYDSLSTNGLLTTFVPAGIISLEARPRGHFRVMPVEITGLADVRLARPAPRPGFTDQLAGGSLLLGRSFARSGKSTATFFSKVGGTIKRAL